MISFVELTFATILRFVFCLVILFRQKCRDCIILNYTLHIYTLKWVFLYPLMFTGHIMVFGFHKR